MYYTLIIFINQILINKYFYFFPLKLLIFIIQILVNSVEVNLFYLYINLLLLSIHHINFIMLILKFPINHNLPSINHKDNLSFSINPQTLFKLIIVSFFKKFINLQYSILILFSFFIIYK